MEMFQQCSDLQRQYIRIYFVIKAFFFAAQTAFRALLTLSLLHIFEFSFAHLLIATGIQQFMIMLFEVPTGVVGDSLGRKRAFRISCIIYIISCLLIAGITLFPWLRPLGIFSILVGSALGYTFQSGALEAWLTHNLKLTNFSGEFHQIYSIRNMISHTSALVFGSLMIFTFYLWQPLPWLIAALLFLAGFVTMWWATRTLHDHEVGHHRLPTFQILEKTMKDIVVMSTRCLRTSSILRAWLALSTGAYIATVLLNRFSPIWLETFPARLDVMAVAVTRPHVISAAWVLFLISRVVGSGLARHYSVRGDIYLIRYALMLIVFFLPFLFFYFPVSAWHTGGTACAFFLVLFCVGLSSEFLDVVADGQFSQNIERDDLRNTLLSAYSLVTEGIPGLYILLWGLVLGGHTDLRLLFQSAPFAAAVFILYGFWRVRRRVAVGPPGFEPGTLRL